MKILKLILPLLFTTLVIQISAQQKIAETEYLEKTSFRLSALPMFVSAFQVDIEKFIPEQNKSFMFSPRAIVKLGNGGISGSEALGIGGKLTYRKYGPKALYKRNGGRGALFGSVSLDYQYTDVKDNWQLYDAFGNWTDQYSSEIIHKGGIDVAIGFQFVFLDFVVLDMYAGGGLRLSESNNPDTRFDNWFGDYGYSGIHPELGIALGLVR